jgi:serine/threonine-protein kinase
MMSQQAAPNPHVVRYYDHASATLSIPGTGETWTFPFTVLEYVDGVTLADCLAREKGSGLGVARSRRILRHIVLALRDVHAQNIVHRDLKPSNVLVETVHGREIAKVTDFGLAKVFDDKLHRTTALAGASVGYAPPEQFEKGNPRVGKPTDVFSLAAILFEMLTGTPCFPTNDPLMVLHSLLMGHRPTLANTRDHLPPELRDRSDVVATLDAILSRALATAPDHRYPSVTQFHEAVEEALASFLTGAMPARVPADRPSIPVRDVPVSGDGATVLADGMSEVSGSYRGISRSRGSSDVAQSMAPSAVVAPFRWQVVAPAAFARPLRAVSLSPDARSAAAVGPEGTALWLGRGWTRLELPRFVAPATIEAAVWFGNHLVLVGASPIVHLRSPDGTYTPVPFTVPGLVFHGAYADSQGVFLAGEQITHAGPVGVIATMTLQQGGLLALGWAMTRLVAPLRAVTRIDQTIIACGDFGTIATLREGRVSTVQVCPQPLFAIVPAGDGSAVCVGGGGFVFRVNQGLEAQLDTVQTTKSLTAVTRGIDGNLYAGGEDRRVLRKEVGGWIRMGANVGASGTMVRALSAGHGTVTAYCDDGSILEGTHAPPETRPG